MILTTKQRETIMKALQYSEIHGILTEEDRKVLNEVHMSLPIDKGFKNQPTIKITMEGGVIQDIFRKDWPMDLTIPMIVFDYAIEGIDPSLLSVDENGNKVLITVHHSW